MEIFFSRLYLKEKQMIYYEQHHEDKHVNVDADEWSPDIESGNLTKGQLRENTNKQKIQYKNDEEKRSWYFYKK